ncbi:hypothetical protein [Helicobacter heilmannii]|uniref:hypothetical protein n=2 Tax=Helicobacter heilmannii TaxID=35817 RepID=UPI0013154EC9|nr:hypothetical protein [Helicobacter heilmannii]
MYHGAMNETLTPRATFGSFKDGRRQEEKKAIEAYVRQNMADFDITKRTHSAEEKARLVTFITSTWAHFSTTLTVRILLETRFAHVNI